MSDSGSSPIMPLVSLAPPPLCLTFLDRLLPSLPPTVRDVDVPAPFRERLVQGGYRPVGLPWRCYVLSLFQIHNETVNVWSHLLAAVCVATRFMMFAVLQGGGILGVRLQGPEGQGLSVDASSLPLVLYSFSAITHLSCSAATHLLQSHSELARNWLRLLDCVGVAVYQYGWALAVCVYSPGSAWKQSMLGQVFLPAAAILAWFSCCLCCLSKLHIQRSLLCQVLLMGVAYLLDASPIAHRLSTSEWTYNSALLLHILQVVLFLLSGFFFSCPLPECFSPGSFDIVGHSHQLFHILLSACTLVQQEALFQDFLWRRPAMVRVFGEEWLLLACASFPLLTVCCTVTALAMGRQVRAQLMKEQR